MPSWIEELKYQHQIRECWFQRKGSHRVNIIQLGRLAKSIELVVTNGSEVLCVYSFVLTHGLLFLLLKFVRQESPMEPTLMR